MLQSWDLNSEGSTDRVNSVDIFSPFLAAQLLLLGTVSITYVIFHYPGGMPAPVFGRFVMCLVHYDMINNLKVYLKDSTNPTQGANISEKLILRSET